MKFYKKIFASKYDSFMENLEDTFRPIREDLLANLEGNILDVGSGTGVNFEHFNINATVIAIEPSSFMLEESKKRLNIKANITSHNLSVNDKALDLILAENSLDYVVCTLVLCTIPDQKIALNKFKKWLKPNGKLIILEHIHGKSKPSKLLHNLINPVWTIVADGCNLNRETDVFIKQAGFMIESEVYFKKGLRFYKGIFSLQ